MTYHFSKPVDILVDKYFDDDPANVDFVVIGSGYGGSIAAARIAGATTENSDKELSVVLLERGKEYRRGEFPNIFEKLPGAVRVNLPGAKYPIGNMDALFNIQIGDGIDVLVGSGLGGTSLINANLAIKLDSAYFNKPPWPSDLRGDELDRAAAAVHKSLDLTHYTENHNKKREFDKLIKGLDKTALLEDPYLSICIDEGRKSSSGVPQPACTACGNCISGCNVGAKNTLVENLIPLADARDAEIYTGATVLRIEPLTNAKRRWRVHFVRTADYKTPREGHVAFLDTDNVILAAGSLGTVEILSRSQQAYATLNFSKRLGQSFSGNGDAIAFTYGQKDRVDGIGEPGIFDHQTVGPTISRIGRFHINGEPVLMEDGAVPYSLAHIFYQIMPNLALLQSIGNTKTPAWFNLDEKKDPLHAYEEVKSYCQTLLIMSNDHSSGELRWISADHLEIEPSDNKRAQDQHLIHKRLTSLDLTGIIPYWPSNSDEDTLLQELHTKLNRCSFMDPMAGGQYIPNPLWELMPKAAGQWLSGNYASGRKLSVHPLGGCAMADTPAEGVVDHRCKVFKPQEPENATSFHEGLYVMDGSIIPESLGNNPFFTISTLSWRACDYLLQENGVTESTIECIDTKRLPDDNRLTTTQTAFGIQPEAIFSEALSGQLFGNKQNRALLAKTFDTSPSVINRLFEYAGLIIIIKFKPTSLLKIGEPLNKIIFNAEIHRNIMSEEVAKAHKNAAIEIIHYNEQSRLLTAGGEFKLLKADAPRYHQHIIRPVKAIYTYFKRRESLRRVIAKALNSSQDGSQDTSPISAVKGFWNIAKMQSTYRTMSYEINSKSNTSPSIVFNSTKPTIIGEKKLGFSLHNPRLFDSLLNLDGTIEIDDQGKRTRIPFKTQVDVSYMLGERLLQITKKADTPSALLGISSLSGFFLRSIFQSSFWGWGSSGYPTSPLPIDTTVPTLFTSIRGKRIPITPTQYALEVQISETNTDKIELQLHRYPAPGKPVLLMLHGLAQGSGIFTLKSIKENAVQYFMEDRKYDVWVLDYRISNRIYPHLTKSQKSDWAMDEIARYDITEAVKKIQAITNQSGISILAHCVGSAAIQMAILKKYLDKTDLNAIIVNSVHAWVAPSPANRVRARLGNYARQLINESILDPIVRPEDRNSILRSLLDRLAYTLSRIDEGESEKHPLPKNDLESVQQGICDRMTLLYGRMWNHKNLSHQTHNEWHNIVGTASANVYQHLYYCVSQKQLLDQNGKNVYLNAEQIRDNWNGIPTLFLHGKQNRVFADESAVLSCFKLKSMLGDPNDSNIPVYAFCVPEYGHMDVLIGNNANQDVYPFLEQFLKRQYDHFIKQYKNRKNKIFPLNEISYPETGPILRKAIRTQENGTAKLNLTYWVAMNRFNTTNYEQLFVNNERYKITNDVRLDKFINTDRDASFVHQVEIQIAPSDYNIPAFSIKNKASDTTPIKPSHYPAWINNKFNDKAQKWTYLLASCRYPGTPFESQQSDKIFKLMCYSLKKDAIDAVFFLGDQIYADASADVFQEGTWQDRYDNRYRQAFGSQYFACLVSRVPTYFCVDDHEFTNNWEGEGLPEQAISSIQNVDIGHLTASQFAYAKDRANLFMGYLEQNGNEQQDSLKLWRPISAPDELHIPTFIMDTRSERQLRRPGTKQFQEGSKPRMISEKQMDAFEEWLAYIPDPTIPKMIISGTVLVPQTKANTRFETLLCREDGFLGYPATLGAMLDTIAKNEIKNIIWVSGDLHFSCWAKINLVSKLKSNNNEPGHQTTMHQVVASGLYAPLHFANGNPDDYQWDKPVSLSEISIETDEYTHTIEYQATLLSAAKSQFSKIEFTIGTNGWIMNLASIQDNRHPDQSEQIELSS